MGISGWGSGATQPAKLTPRLTVYCEYPDPDLGPTVVSFRLGFLTATDAHKWFLSMLEEHEEFEVETDRAGGLSMPFWSETVRQVVV